MVEKQRQDLRELRWARGFVTQRDLADKAGLKFETISHWELGTVREPHRSLISKIATALDVDIETVYTAIDESWSRAQKRPRRPYRPRQKTGQPHPPDLAPAA